MKNPVYVIAVLSLLTHASCSDSREKDAAPEVKESAGEFDSTRRDATRTVPEEMPPDSAAMAQAWENYMKPGPMHQLMATWNGKWEAEIRSSNAPGAPLTNSDKVDAEFKTIMNGLYHESKYRGRMMGMPFEGQGITGYDNARQKWITTWVDNMGSGVLYMEGDYDQATRTLSFAGKSTDAVSGRQNDFRQVIRMVDDDHQVLEMYGNTGGNEVKLLEIHLARKK